MNILSRSSFAETQTREWAVYNKIAWRLVPFLLILYVVSFLDRVNVGFAKLQMAADIGLSDAAFGFGAGIFFLGYCLCEIPSNLLLQHFGAKIWIARILVMWGAVSVAMMFVQGEKSFFAMRFLLGVMEAGFYPGVILYLSYWFPARLRAQICALFFLGIPISVVFGGPISGWVMQSLNGALGLKGWQWLFLLEGAPAILLGVISYFYLVDGPAKAKWLTAPETSLVTDALAAEDRAKQAAGYGHRFGDAMRDPNVWMLAVINFAQLGGIYGVSFWLPQIIKDLGVKDMLTIGFITAVPFGVAGLAMVLVGRRSDRTGERKWHSVVATLVGAAGLIIAGYAGHAPYLSIFGLTLATAGALAGITVLWALPAAILSGPAAAAGIALMATIGNSGGYVMPFAIGWVRQSTGQVEFGLYAMAAMMIVGAGVLLLTPRLRGSRQANAAETTSMAPETRLS